MPASSSPSPSYSSRLGLPLQSFFSQAALVLNPSPRMMGMNIRMTACEATLESLLQLSLQLYIIFLRSDTMPSLLQVSGLIGTFKCPLWGSRPLPKSHKAMDIFCRLSPSSPLCSWCPLVRLKILSSPRQTRKRRKTFLPSSTLNSAFKKKAAKSVRDLLFPEIMFPFSARCLPFYFFLTIFRVMSFSLVLVVLRVYSIILYVVLLSILLLGVLISALRNKDPTSRAIRFLKTTRREQGLVYFLVVPFRTIFSTGLPPLKIESMLISTE